MAASVLLTVGPQPALIAEIVSRAAALQRGQAAGQVGPVIDAASKVHPDKKYASILFQSLSLNWSFSELYHFARICGLGKDSAIHQRSRARRRKDSARWEGLEF